jgi:hypothetical protein
MLLPILVINKLFLSGFHNAKCGSAPCGMRHHEVGKNRGRSQERAPGFFNLNDVSFSRVRLAPPLPEALVPRRGHSFRQPLRLSPAAFGCASERRELATGTIAHTPPRVDPRYLRAHRISGRFVASSCSAIASGTAALGGSRTLSEQAKPICVLQRSKRSGQLGGTLLHDGPTSSGDRTEAPVQRTDYFVAPADERRLIWTKSHFSTPSNYLTPGPGKGPRPWNKSFRGRVRSACGRPISIRS